MATWMKATEDKLKNYSLAATVTAKEAQAQTYKALVDEVKSKEADLDRFEDQSQALTQAAGGESRVASHVAKMHTRYQILLASAKVPALECVHQLEFNCRI